MLFNSQEFIYLFFPLVALVFFLIGARNVQLAAGWLGLASLFFYGWWSVQALPLLLASITVNFALARLIAASDGRRRSWLLTLGVTANLALLGVFKYADFFLSNLNQGFAALAWPEVPLLAWTLPIGISFYTFTQIAFLVDTTEGKVRESSFIHYLLFVTYFPHLIAGPVLHHAQMMPQFERANTYRPAAQNIVPGLIQFTIGLAKKLLIADPLGAYADLTFGAMSTDMAIGRTEAWLALLAYALQIYFDFSGYSDMAIGLSRCLGITLPDNFNSPYRASNIIDFWRRWHISLSTFLRDYLYFRLGGNRRGPARRHLNLALTMILGGLWHGASWNFALWGALHGLYLIANHGWQSIVTRSGMRPPSSPVWRGAGQAITFVLVILAWVPFRSVDLDASIRYYQALFGPDGWPVGPFRGHELPFKLSTFYQTLVVGSLIAWTLPNSRHWSETAANWVQGTGFLRRLPALLQGLGCGLLLVFCVSRLNRQSPFLYFQF
ncbi:MBOAT family O-acyltransferase [Sphaerotilus mobilis]|uniref:Probable alginate O-acetylase AlgI n=1 Tax=Sphaerotilus mobilis TaxID=47994 RepID=A0A4Q7LBV7_9BURK|nr:MBOAT family O-acyltransferase [Sphaerotilus mobilis]RZS47544.1 alginate O-acetyltransferase complex protein AlgI [Sphaerotilus mobilis]